MEDGCLRIWKNDQVIVDLKECDAVTFLTPLSNSAFGYALANGTVGVYDKRGRLWRIKVTHFSTEKLKNMFHRYSLAVQEANRFVNGLRCGQ